MARFFRARPSPWPRPLARLAAALGLMLGLAATCPAHAWNDSGHLQIALVAYDTLDAATRERLVALLREHPRFEADFLPRIPPELTSEADKNRWLFAFAATWPDVARDQPAFTRPGWHWVNLPLELNSGKLVTCKQAREAFPASVLRVRAKRAEQRREPASAPSAAQAPSAAPTPSAPSAPADATGAGTDFDPKEGSIAGELPRLHALLHDTTKPAAERALALSWVLHLVGDVHQPLHAVALFTERLFFTGDRGGNDITVQGQRLHALWDDLLGKDEPFATTNAKAEALLRDARLRGLAARARQSLDVDAWLDEDCDIARRAVYVPPLLEAVRRFEQSGREGKPDVSLGAKYKKRAQHIARERAAQAAARLAAWLETARLEAGSAKKGGASRVDAQRAAPP